MVTTDHILFVKEAKTCSYVLVVHTPRLCGEPGFKSKRDSGEETPIRCREVVDVLPPHDPLSASKVYYSEQPFRVPRRKTVLPTPAPKDKSTTPSSSDNSKSKEDIYSQFVKQAVQAFLQGSVSGKNDGKSREGGAGDDLSSTSALKQALEDGEVIVEFIDGDDELPAGSNRLVEALIAAGFDVRSEVISTKRTGKGSGKGDSKSSSQKGKDEDKDSSS
jgi:protein OS-9